MKQEWHFSGMDHSLSLPGAVAQMFAQGDRCAVRESFPQVSWVYLKQSMGKFKPKSALENSEDGGYSS